MKRRAFGAAIAACIAVGLSASPAYGHAPPPEHNHFLTVPGSGTVVQVGPHVCGSPVLHDAFHNFHDNVHVGTPTDSGPLVISPTLCQ